MYQDMYGRVWDGPYPFTAEMIKAHAPRDIGIYQVVWPMGGDYQVVYIGIATGETIYGRLRKHCSGSGNQILGSIGQPNNLQFIFYRCDGESARQIESHVLNTKKPVFNFKNENKYYIPSIYLH